jgi:hypothetical protein
VGKLEPFKPEEAKRVRADGYIVKPFEASELLSALSKLEDKIVPRNEPSKPGRFGRIAAAEEARFDKTMAVEEDSGWKNRIAFPSKKKEKEKEPEPEVAVVPIAPKNARTEFREMAVEAPAAQKSEETVDLGALANAGLPKDVTPEEIAALAAAAARIKGRIAEANREEPACEIPAVQAASQDATKPSGELSGAVPATEVVGETKESETKAAAESEQVSSAGGHSQERPEEQSVTAAIAPASQAVPEPAGEPVTMAAAAAVGQSISQASRWTAVSVALAPEDTGISLEEEMKKAYAEFAAAESGHGASVTADSLSSLPAVSASVPATIAPEALQDLSAVSSAAAEAVTAAVKELEHVASAYAAQAPAQVESSGLDSASALPVVEPEKRQAWDVVKAPAVASGESSQRDHAEPVKPELAEDSALSREPAPRRRQLD